MTALRDTLAPTSRAALDSLARELSGDSATAPRVRSYGVAPVASATSRADMLTELHLRAAMNGEQLGGVKRLAWQRCQDSAGVFYRCRITLWGRYDVNSSRTVTHHTLRELWDSLADRGHIPRAVWCEDSAFLAFLMLGRVGQLAPRVSVPFTARGQRETWQRYHPRLALGSSGELLQLARIVRDGRERWGYVPRDRKHGDAV